MKRELNANSKKVMKKKYVFLSLFLVLLFGFWKSLPSPLFSLPLSTVAYTTDNHLLGAKIAADGQWRFPALDTVPSKFKEAIVHFEDQRFFNHLGVDLKAIARALKLNLKHKKVVSGGSTITMQVMRMQRGNQSRTIFQKIIETLLAIRLEISYSKDEILALYASNAPFGGNVVGLEAASWRYFGKKSDYLSWAEAAVLAVLPNSPAMIHTGRNRDALKSKRNRLLKNLNTANIIDDLTLLNALDESIPLHPKPLPRLAPHYLEWIAAQKNIPKNIITTIEGSLQKQINIIAENHQKILKNNQVHNLAILVLDVENDNVIAYVGNAAGTGAEHQEYVNVINAPRSTGSLLKPALFALMMQEGQLLPKSLVKDIPIYLKDFRPENFSKTYDGVVPFNNALYRSLNVPFVNLLKEYGVDKFHWNLKKLGLSTLNKNADHYGLSLILGGAETTLWDITNLYASMAKRLRNFYPYNGQYDKQDFGKAKHIFSNQNKNHSIRLSQNTEYLKAAAIWQTFEAMKNVERPDELGNWRQFKSQEQIAWKTGTSHGSKDAWAIGVNPKYAVGVWVGNADGEGRPGLTGIKSAAPILFDVFDKLPNIDWFDQPYDEMKKVAACRNSGYLAKNGCPIDTIWAISKVEQARTCPYHQLIFLDETLQWQVNQSCYPTPVSEYWFNLPPIEEHYYTLKYPNYNKLPPFHADCINVSTKVNDNIRLIYPVPNAQIYVPIGLRGNTEKAIFKAVHSDPLAILYWHLDDRYIQSTNEFHQIEIGAEYGKHILTIVDNKGGRLEQKFEVISK